MTLSAANIGQVSPFEVLLALDSLNPTQNNVPHWAVWTGCLLQTFRTLLKASDPAPFTTPAAKDKYWDFRRAQAVINVIKIWKSIEPSAGVKKYDRETPVSVFFDDDDSVEAEKEPKAPAAEKEQLALLGELIETLLRQSISAHPITKAMEEELSGLRSSRASLLNWNIVYVLGRAFTELGGPAVTQFVLAQLLANNTSAAPPTLNQLQALLPPSSGQ